jgi:CBS domain-containing protein
MEAIAFIRAHAPFDRLNQAELERVREAVETVRFPQGAAILEQAGPPSRHLYVIRSGAARLVRDGDVVQLLEEGEPFGERSLLSGESPSFAVVAEEETVAYRIPEAVFRELAANPAFEAFFTEGLGQRLRRTRKREAARAGDELAVPVASLVTRPPVFVDPGTSVAEAARIMDAAQTNSVLVADQPPGIVTDRDLRSRVVAGELALGTPVRDVMSRPLVVTSTETPVYGALLLMLEENVHHLAVTGNGRIVGVITDGDLLRHRARGPLYLVKRIESGRFPEGLTSYGDEVARMVELLLVGGLDPVQIGRVVAGVNDALTRRLLRLAEEELGPPPSPYAWIVLGSEGRMEQVLLTDQDNALVFQDETSDAEAYFARLADRVVEGLIEAGFPRCPGGYMATRWRKALPDWQRLLADWIETPEPQALLDALIFFDFRAVHGDLSLEPLERRLRVAGDRAPFLTNLARSALGFRPPLTVFRRIRNEGGEVDLKRSGIVPIVSLARLYALEAKSPERSTVTRLRAAAEAGVLSRNGAETLAESFRFLTGLRLREQLERLRSGMAPSNSVRVASLSSLESRHLKEAFRAIAEQQKAVALRLRVER